MTRVLPGVYVTFNDYSALPEGETNLNVGFVLAAPRGPIGKAELVTSPTDFLSKFTLTGSPTIKDDKTFWSILQVLKYTNMVYVSRIGKESNMYYGGAVVGTDSVTALTATSKVSNPDSYKFTGDNDLFLITGIDPGKYNNDLGIVIKNYVDNKDDLIDLFENEAAMNAVKPFQILVYDCTNRSNPQLLEEFLVSMNENAKAFDGSVMYIKTVLESSAYIRCALNESGTYAISMAEGTTGYTNLEVRADKIEGGTQTWVYKAVDETASTKTYKWYNTEDIKKRKGKSVAAFKADVANYTKATEAEGDTLNIVFTCPDRSGYTAKSTGNNPAIFGGGYNKEVTELVAEDAVGALTPFEDKSLPISLLGNGSGTLYENPIYQQALLSLVNQRKDCMVFLNTREQDEKATLNSKKATNIVEYKKEDLGSTSYYGCMYGPHVNYSDVFNSRQVKLGADSTAIAGWLDVLLSRGYPYAYAGPQNGLISGVTTNWKIGDNSGEATVLNDASVNYIAYDTKVGRYYMQCQNTLQIANSSLRNIGAVLNVLDIKETFMVYFKEYLQLPITNRLREEILQKGKDYMETSIKGMGRCINYSFVDATTDTDLSNNTLRYILAIALTPYAQKIYLTMNIVNANYDFSITQGA